MERVIVEAIPFNSFKERIKLTKELIGKAKIEIYDRYIYIEKIERDEENKELTKCS